MPFNIFKDFPKNVQNEFKRREVNYGVNVEEGIDKNALKYRGGRTPWIRIASGVVYRSPSGLVPGEVQVLPTSALNVPNHFTPSGEAIFLEDVSLNPNLIEANGLVLEPNISDFRNFYGIDDKKQFIAREIIPSLRNNGMIDILNVRNQPGPIVDSVTVESKGDMGLTRSATFTWKAFTQDQFDVLSDYFCIAGKTIVLEWGWHTFFGKDGGELLDLTDAQYIKDIASGKSFGQIEREARLNHSQKHLNDETLDEIYEPRDAYEYSGVSTSSNTRTLFDTIKTSGDIHHLSYSPYEALMALGNNDYDLFIGIVVDYDISITDGVYEVTVTMKTKGESFLSLTNNESGLNKYFSNSVDSGFRKFLDSNKDREPRIFIKNEPDKTKAVYNSSGETSTPEIPANYNYSIGERRRLANISHIFFNISPVYYNTENFKERLSNWKYNIDDVRINSLAGGSGDGDYSYIRKEWGPDFAKNILPYVYATDKNLIELFNRSARLVVDWKIVLPQADDWWSPASDWTTHREFLHKCYTGALAVTSAQIGNSIKINTQTGAKTEATDAQKNIKGNHLAITNVLTKHSLVSSAAFGVPVFVFEGLGKTIAGQQADVHISDFWNTPNLLDVVRYYLELGFRNTSDTKTGVDPSSITGTAITKDIIAKAQLGLSAFDLQPIQNIARDITIMIKKIRSYLYLGLGITAPQAKAMIARLVVTSINPFIQKSEAIPLDNHKYDPAKGNIAYDNDIWGEDSISLIVSALRIQQNTFNGSIVPEVPIDGDLSKIFSTGGAAPLLDSDDPHAPESSYSYISYGLLEEIINTRILGSNYAPILDSRETQLWFHKNMVSSDKSTCILPNSNAPSYNLSNVNEIWNGIQEPIGSTQAIGSTPAPKSDALIPSLAFQDLTINGISHNSYPRLSNSNLKQITEDNPVGEMFLYSIFIDTELIERVFSSTADLYDALIELLGYVNGALGRRYDFKIARVGDTVQIIDFTNPEKNKYNGEYTFPYNTSRSFIKSLDISLSLPDQIAIQAFTGLTQEGSAASILTGNTVFGDMFELPLRPIINEVEEIKQTPVTLPQCFFELAYNGPDGTYATGKHEDKKHKNNFVYPHQATIDLNTQGGTRDDMVVVPNSEISIGIDGMAGIQFFNVFNVVFVPRRFRQVGRFFVKGISHTITPETWDSSIDAQYMIVPDIYWNKDNIIDNDTIDTIDFSTMPQLSK